MALEQGDYAAARAHFVESLRLFQEIGSPSGIACGLDGFANLAAAQGQPERAARLFGAEETLNASHGVPASFQRPFSARYWTEVEGTLGERRFAMLRAEGHAMTSAQAITYALDEMDAEVA